MTPALRAAEDADAAAVADVLIGSRKAFLPYASSAHPDGDVRLWVRHVLIPAGGVTVAVVGGAIAGVLAMSRDGPHHWIDQLYVHPAHVNRGIGSRLLAHAMAVAPPPLRLYTFQQNEGARRFYERHGFVAIAFGDGRHNEEHCPDVLYELPALPAA
jgi:GNAT superfamily N-acetyltransferase